MIKEVVKKLRENNFEPTQFIETQSFYDFKEEKQVQEPVNILPFEHVYIDKNKVELYLLVEKKELFNEEEIKQFDKKISSFIAFLDYNDPIKYNINLILLCPLNLKTHVTDSNTKKILAYERNKFNSRKIFLDTSNKNFHEELEILPSFPIDLGYEFKSDGYKGLVEDIKTIIPNELFEELSKEIDEINVNKISYFLEKKFMGDKIE